MITINEKIIINREYNIHDEQIDDVLSYLNEKISFVDDDVMKMAYDKDTDFYWTAMAKMIRVYVSEYCIDNIPVAAELDITEYTMD